MKKLFLGALLAGFLVACGGGGNNNTIHLVDGSTDGTDVCNVLTQTGCMAGEKCTWFVDATMPQPLGHIGCAPDNGTVATAGACMYGAPGASGFDNCVKGDVCSGGKCKVVCDQNLGTPMCAAGYACATYEGLFGPVGMAVAAGVCDKTCDPLADNDFDGSGTGVTKAGSACDSGASSTIGCYGFPDSTNPTHWSCTREVNTTVVHRMACTTANGCANSGGNPYLNGCAQGYLPLLYDMTGSTTVDCIAMCKPGSCYMGNCGASNINAKGLSPHTCTLTDARGTFNAMSSTNNGDHCAYSWYFEIGTTTLTRSATSDTVGFCMDHQKYKYDPTGGSNYTAPWPRCDSLATPGFGSGSAIGAADFACVDTTTGMVMAQGKHTGQPAIVDRPRFPYGAQNHE
jgi:hypothetical protein